MVKEITKNDPKVINRVRAAGFLALIKVADPAPAMLSALYGTDKPAEALLIIHSLALVGTSGRTPYTFHIDNQKMKAKVVADRMATWRLDYLLNGNL